MAEENKKQLSPEEDIKHNRDIAGLSYIPPISIFVYLFRKDSPFIQANAKQGFALFLLMVVGWILSFIPVIKIVGFFMIIGAFIFMIMGFMKAFNSGEKINIPVLTAYFDKHDFQDIVDAAQGAVKKASDNAQKTMKDTVEKTKDVAQNTAEQAKDVAENTAQKAQSVANEATSKDTV